MADFDIAIKTVLSDEGGLVENAQDPGGATKFGISLHFYQQNIKKWADKYDIEDLTVDDAKAIYQKYFWTPNRYNMIASQKIATKVFDIAVNIGTTHANKCLQKATLASSDMIIEADGILGDRSFYVVNHCPEEQLYTAFKAEVASYYRNLVEQNPKLQVFLDGWLKRCYRDV